MRHFVIVFNRSYQGLTQEFYNICYDFKTLWSYRLDFYSKKYKSEGLDDKTLNVIIDLVEDNFKEWISFFNALKDNKKVTSFIYKYVDTANVNENLKLVNDEYNKFKKVKLNYVKELLDKAKEHDLFKIHTYELTNRLTDEEKTKLYKRYNKYALKI